MTLRKRNLTYPLYYRGFYALNSCLRSLWKSEPALLNARCLGRMKSCFRHYETLSKFQHKKKEFTKSLYCILYLQFCTARFQQPRWRSRQRVSLIILRSWVRASPGASFLRLSLTKLSFVWHWSDFSDNIFRSLVLFRVFWTGLIGSLKNAL